MGRFRTTSLIRLMWFMPYLPSASTNKKRENDRFNR